MIGDVMGETHRCDAKQAREESGEVASNQKSHILGVRSKAAVTDIHETLYAATYHLGE